MTTLRKQIKNSISKIRVFEDNRDRNGAARRHLKVVEQEKGKLSASDKKRCDEYAKEVLGSKSYAPWLYTYTAFSGKFKEGWIPDNYYGQHVIPNINGDYGKICHKKAVIESLIKVSHSIDICYYTNQLFIDTNYQILNENSIKNLIFAQSDKVVFKLETSEQGKGIYFFDENNFDVSKIKRLGNGVFQNYISQHPYFFNFTRNSVATIRITTVCNDLGEISVRAGWLKFAQGDDTHCMGDATIKVPYDIKTGKLYDHAYFGSWKSMTKLPDNDYSFAQTQLPQYDKCISEVKRMHSNIPFARCLGWDLMVDDADNVVVIEVNGGHSGIRFTEAVQGPCFKGLNWENLHKIN
ncbi:sugar-transfer associated ATP-grasp domain-containing protein [Winogradskyella poriferorum]|uniref:sugar-transfer associated ATP-grasp domain-containing protein n=1 Tax=Winogradskyella poriferorum TaxID=307627 RepID=UPI003D64DF7B